MAIIHVIMKYIKIFSLNGLKAHFFIKNDWRDKSKLDCIFYNIPFIIAHCHLLGNILKSTKPIF